MKIDAMSVEGDVGVLPAYVYSGSLTVGNSVQYNLVYFGLPENEGQSVMIRSLNICAQPIDKEKVDAVIVSAHQYIRSFRKNSEICGVEIPPRCSNGSPSSIVRYQRLIGGNNENNNPCPKTHGCCIGLRAYLNLHEPVRTVARLCSGRASCFGRAPAVLVAVRRCAARQPPRPQEWPGATRPELRWYLLP